MYVMDSMRKQTYQSEHYNICYVCALIIIEDEHVLNCLLLQTNK